MNLPTPANLFGSILFGAIGLAAFIYGRKSGALKPVVVGLALMVYPYFLASTLALYSVGAALTSLLFLFRD